MAKLEQSYESIIIVSTKVGEEGTKPFSLHPHVQETLG